MSTRGTIARLTGLSPLRFRGRYHHWDSYPSGLGQTLWSLYHGHFGQDLNALLRVLLDEHPAGWSTINSTNFTLLPGFSEPRWGVRDNPVQQEHDGVAPACYCHGDRNEEGHELTQENASGSGCEWTYAFVPGKEPAHDVMLVLSSYTNTGQKMVGFFGLGDPYALWIVVAAVALHAAQPNWEALDAPMSPVASLELPDCGSLVQRDAERPGIYVVRVPSSPLQYVRIQGTAQERVFYCTCSAHEAAPCPDCEHAQAVRLHLERQRAEALTRRDQGVYYTGGSLLSDGQGRAAAFAWRNGQPSVLLSHPDYVNVFGFDWEDDSPSVRLALAMLLNFCGDEDLAFQLFRDFDLQMLGALAIQAHWQLSAPEIEIFLQRHHTLL